MCPNASLKRYQQGLGLMGAIFVITIMAVIVVGLAKLVVTSKESYGYEIMSARAFLLAESGGQLALSKILQEGDNDCSGVPSQLAAAELQNCNLMMDCQRVEIPTGSGINYFTISATATCGSGTDQAIRRITLRAQR